MTGVELALPARASLGEGPTWDPAAARLVWVDILASRVHWYDPLGGRTSVMTTGQHVGAAKPRAGGGIVVNLRDGVAVYDADGAFRWLHREPVPGRRANDAAVDASGTLWAGTMRYDEAPGGGTLSRVAPDGTVEPVLDDVAVSNGTDWSPDGSLMYYVDSPTRRIDVFDVDPDTGLVRKRRPFAVVEEGAGFPDGLTVDADGCVWVALWDGAAVRRYTPRGALDRVVEVPVRRPTACAFGGPHLTDLYITSARTGLGERELSARPLAGALLVLPGAGQGMPEVPYAG
ncbi:SMP-30/gluconolactonase/LRE family protein [Streptomyces sp. NPDC088354]|uniref:SMP-30/gluconolactonase/LRE family protein n=1 Tax=unclassified Streptomyces TaxID=2593676 RepID=UPI0029A76445|nr:SMP-30/gluconolactonase/LRE family protein [Streptomyces sp. MI02-7b]MDX3075727.1 SMP-30/gluconolactonase/LRE family protein [Streptomyces sp. MI02-7b]